MPKVLAPPPGQVIRQTTDTQVLPAPENGSHQEKNYDALDYMESMKPEDWTTHVAWIYRVEPPIIRGAGEKGWVTQYEKFFTLRDIQKDLGGGVWRIMIKKDRERVADSKHSVAGQPRDLTQMRIQQEMEMGPSLTAPSADGVNSPSIVSQAMNMVANPNVQAANVESMRAATTAAIDLVKANVPQQLSITEIIAIAKELSPKQAGFLDGPFGPIAIAVVTKLVDKLFTDPLEHFAKIAELAKMFGGGGSTANDWKTAMVQAAPQLANAVTAGLHELRLGAEAQGPRPMQQQLPPASAPPPSAPNPGATAGSPAIAGSQATAGNNVITMAGPEKQPPLPGTVPAAGPQRMEVPLQFIWQKIYEFMDDPAKTGADIGKFLDELDPGFIESVKAYSVEQIQGFVSGNATIAFVAAHPRFKQCLTELLAWANQPEAPQKPA